MKDNKMSRSKRLILWLVILVLVVSSVVIFKAVDNQNRIEATYKTERDAEAILKAKKELDSQNKDIVKIREFFYISTSAISVDYFKELLQADGWEFKDRMGSKIYFGNNKHESLVISTRLVYSKNYHLWEIEY